MPEAAPIQLNGLTKRFGWGTSARMALDGLTLNIAAGQVYGFLGPNGAGKTTTIRILLDLVRPTGGSALLYGSDPRRDRSVLRRVGALVEDAALYPHLTGRGNLELLRLMDGHHDKRGQSVEAVLARVGLEQEADRRFGAYSTGLKQRLGLAAALLHNPDLLILDEPTNGLDPVGVVAMRTLIRELVEKDGKTIFLSSHLLGEVEHLCDRVAIINRGRLVQEGAIADLLGGQAERVQLEVDDTAKALAALRDWQTHPLDLPGALEVVAARDQVPHIVARLVAENVAVFRVNAQRESLEELFMSLVNAPIEGDQPA
ncbi:MAG TPA: ABC transporter ATP-binding protein [Aggregatilineales bacterium]|nr:ABC transporter ATP-binding protein [Aggregatilineales bacterium]